MEDALDLYHRVVRVANQFLRNAKMFELAELQDHNPTYEELAKIMVVLSSLISDLADDDDPMLGQKAKDYANIMTEMAQAIADKNEDRLSECVIELDRKPGL